MATNMTSKPLSSRIRPKFRITYTYSLGHISHSHFPTMLPYQPREYHRYFYNLSSPPLFLTGGVYVPSSTRSILHQSGQREGWPFTLLHSSHQVPIGWFRCRTQTLLPRAI